MTTTQQNKHTQLTARQKRAALDLLAKRPPVAPGTRAIISELAKVTWYELVTDEMVRLGIEEDKHATAAFCDLAGVAD